MPAPTRATVGLAAALLLATPVLGACGAGRTSVTAKERAAIDGAQTNAGDLQLRNVHFDAPSGSEWATGSQVPLAMYVVNRGGEADQLLSVEATGVGSATLTPSPMDIKGGGLLTTGAAHTQGATNAATVVLTTTALLRPGQTVPVTFTFARAGAVTLNVPVAIS